MEKLVSDWQALSHPYKALFTNPDENMLSSNSDSKRYEVSIGVFSGLSSIALVKSLF